MYLEWSFVFLLGGGVYAGLEILWRRRTHWTMFLTGGLCFTLLYTLTTHTALPMLIQCALGALIGGGIFGGLRGKPGLGPEGMGLLPRPLQPSGAGLPVFYRAVVCAELARILTFPGNPLGHF